MRLRAATMTVALVIIATTLRAYTTDCVPGALASSLAGQRDIKKLTITGSADASDLFFIADSLPSLTALDISGLSIAPYRGKALKGRTAYPASAIPAATFGGTGLQSVTLPAGVVVGDMAFASSALSVVEIPTDVKLGSAVFADCRKLTGATFAQGVMTGTHTFRNCTALAEAHLGGIGIIAEGTFSGCPALSEVDGMQNVTEIGAEAFLSAGVTALNFSASPLRSIGRHAFAGSGLKEIILPETLSDAGRGAFFACTSLRKVLLPSSLAAISDYMFTGAALDDMTVPESTARLGRYALKGSDLVVLVLPAALHEVGDGAMEGMRSLMAIDVNALADVPATGADVWAGVETAKVKLYVGASRAAFENAPQWQDFDIVSGPSSADEQELSPLRAMLSGGLVVLESSASDIAEVLVFKASGDVVLAEEPHAPAFTADLRHLSPGTVVIVAATLADGKRSVFKFAQM